MRSAPRAGDRPGPVVFEGNAPADVARNPALAAWLAGAEPPADPPRAWLGEAMALTDHTAAAFRRQNGNNLVIVGQNDEAALGMMTAALVSLAAPRRPALPRPSSSLTAPRPTRPAAPSRRSPKCCPAPCAWRAGGMPRALIAELSAELARRQQAADTEAPPAFFLLHALHRCRDLRRPDDDFGFAPRGDAPPSPPQQLANLLREGPALGLHALIWCDTLANLQRALDRQRCASCPCGSPCK